MAELVLLATFVLGIFIAGLIVADKTRVTYSESIELAYSGLSASVPQGEGWENLMQWQYNAQNNLYFLTSQFRISNQPEMYVEWQYLLAEDIGEIAQKLKHTVLRLNGVIFETSQTQVDDLFFQWVKFGQASIDKEGIVAIAELPSGRYLRLIIRTEAQSVTLPHIFQNAIASVQYEANELLEQSSNFVVSLKSKGVADLVKTSTGNDMENIYTIEKNLPNKQGIALVGYSLERFENSFEVEPAPGVSAKQLNLFGGPRATISQSDFVSPKDFSQITWDTHRKRTKNTNWLNSSIETEPSGQMTYTVNKASHQYHLSNIVVPEILAESAARELLDYDADSVLIEILASDGRIVPTVFTKSDPELVFGEDAAEEGQDLPEYVVKLQYLHEENSHEYFCFDSDKFITEKHYIGSKQYYIYRSSNWAKIISKFPGDVALFDLHFPSRASTKI